MIKGYEDNFFPGSELILCYVKNPTDYTERMPLERTNMAALTLQELDSHGKWLWSTHQFSLESVRQGRASLTTGCYEGATGRRSKRQCEPRMKPVSLWIETVKNQ